MSLIMVTPVGVRMDSVVKARCGSVSCFVFVILIVNYCGVDVILMGDNIGTFLL